MGAAVRASLDRMYDPQPAGCTLVFTEPKPAHDDVIKRVLYQPEQGQVQVGSESDSDAAGVTSRSHTYADGASDMGNRNTAFSNSREEAEIADFGKRDEPDDDRVDDSLISDILNSTE